MLKGLTNILFKGWVEAKKFVKTGGTSSQFLKADGSIDESNYVELGETSSTAYRGDRGKIAYDHSQTPHAPSNAEANVQSDWNATGGDAFIKNKPTIPTNNNQLQNGAGYLKQDGSLPITGKITLDYLLSKVLPPQGQKMAFLKISDNSLARVYIVTSENGYQQGHELLIYRSRAVQANTIEIIKTPNWEWHRHSNDVVFSYDEEGNIYAEKVKFSTGRPFYLFKAEELRGTVTILDGTLIVESDGTDLTSLYRNSTLENDAGFITGGYAEDNYLPRDGSKAMSGDLDLGSNRLLFTNLSSSNVDHIWVDDSSNSFHFTHDAAKGTTGNSTLVAGGFKKSGSSDSYMLLGGGGTANTGTGLNLSGSSLSFDTSWGDERYWRSLATITNTTGNIFDDDNEDTRVTEPGGHRISYPGASGHIITSSAGGSTSILQIGATYSRDYRIRIRVDSSGWRSWEKIWTDYNLDPVTRDTDQTITGQKTFGDKVIVNDNGGIEGRSAANSIYRITRGTSGALINNYGEFAVATGQLGTTEVNTRLYINRNGNVGIGTTTPTDKLDVNGNARVRGNITASKLFATAATGSLRSLKENIRPYNESALDIWRKMEISWFDYKDKSTLGMIGPMADDESTSNDILTEDNKAVNLYNAIFVAGKAIKEQDEIVQEQESRIKTLEERIERLEKMIYNG